jgi:hypothetical protein
MRLFRQTRACKLFAAPIAKALSRLAEAKASDRYSTAASSQGWIEPAEDTNSTLINLCPMVFNLLTSRSYAWELMRVSVDPLRTLLIMSMADIYVGSRANHFEHLLGSTSYIL